MARLTKEELDNLKFILGKDNLYSWSRVSCYLQDKWEYYLRYVVHAKPDQEESLYSKLGDCVHNQMEKLYTTTITNKEMVDNLISEYELNQVLQKRFVRGDNKDQTDANDKIANKYLSCCKDFLSKATKIKGEAKCEVFYPCIINDYALQCYIDFINFTKNEEGKLKADIIDYKTSTFYTPAKLIQNKCQLQIYGLAYMQATNCDFSQIRLGWNFIKYIMVDYPQKNGKIKNRRLERNDIGGHLNKEGNLEGGLISPITMWAKELKYSEDAILGFIDELFLTNSIEHLPEDIKSKFTFYDCILDVPFNQEEVDVLTALISGTIKEIEDKEAEYNLTKNELLWWQDVSYDDEYRLFNLSSYSRKLHKPFDEYLKIKEERMADAEREQNEVKSDFDSVWNK